MSEQTKITGMFLASFLISLIFLLCFFTTLYTWEDHPDRDWSGPQDHEHTVLDSSCDFGACDFENDPDGYDNGNVRSDDWFGVPDRD